MVTAASLLSLSLAACSTIGTNTDEYISQVKTVLSHYNSGSEAAAEDDANRLPTPTNLTVDDKWNFTFDAVAGAGYYVVTLNHVTDSDKEEYASVTVEDDGSAAYTGDFGIISTNAFTGNEEVKATPYGQYIAKVVAVPKTDDTEHKKSKGGTNEFTLSGEVAAPAFEYLWDYFTGTLTVQISNLADYSTTQEPERITCVLTNTADAADAITLNMEKPSLSGRVYEVSTQDVTPGATYAIATETTWADTYVTNPQSSVAVGSVTTDAANNVASDGFGRIDNDIYMNLDYPAVQMNFDTAAGGQAGKWYFFYYTDSTDPIWGLDTSGSDFSMYYTATPKAADATPESAADGARYSYDISVCNVDGEVKAWSLGGGRAYEDVALPGTLNIYDDGTFLMTIHYTYFGFDKMTGSPYDVASSQCEGTWTDNGDGTINLSYNSDTAKLTGETA